MGKFSTFDIVLAACLILFVNGQATSIVELSTEMSITTEIDSSLSTDEATFMTDLSSTLEPSMTVTTMNPATTASATMAASMTDSLATSMTVTPMNPTSSSSATMAPSMTDSTVVPVSMSVSDMMTASSSMVSSSVPMQNTTMSPTTQAPPCVMNKTADWDASNYYALLSTTSVEGCEAVCRIITQCQFFVYVNATSTCKMYDTVVNTTAKAGYIAGTKELCTGGRCCFNRAQDMGTMENATLTLMSTAYSCRDLCLSISTCTATVYGAMTCKLFTAQPITTANNGTTLFTKSCPTVAFRGALMLTDVCNHCDSTHASVFGALAIALAYWFISYCW